MSGLLDIHIQLALQNGWELFGKSSTNWAALFPGVPAATVEDWRAELVSAAPRFLTRVTDGVHGIPYVSVEADDEPLETEFVGGGSTFTSAGLEERSISIRQRASVTIEAPTPDLTRALHVWARGVLMAAQLAFLQAGYEGFEYSGSQGLEPDPELVSEQAGAYRRVQFYEARSVVTVPVFAPDGALPQGKYWFLQAEGVKTSARAGTVQSAPIDDTNTDAGGVILPPHRQLDDTGAPGGVTIKE